MSSPHDALGALDAHVDQDPRVAEAMEEAARTQAHAAAARLRATLLREQAETLSKRSSATDPPRANDADHAGAGAVRESESPSARAVRRWRRWLRPTRRMLAVGAAVLLTGAGAGVSGYVVWHHRMMITERQNADEFTAAARDRTITLMSINAGSARSDVQRIIDDSTGAFKAKTLITADDLVKTIERTKISTKTTVKSVVVESMTKDSAVMLIAARADATGPDNEKPPPPRSWRIIMTLQRDGGQIKMANIEMLP